MPHRLSDRRAHTARSIKADTPGPVPVGAMRIWFALALLPTLLGFLVTTWEDLQTNHNFSFADYVLEYSKKYDIDEYPKREAIFGKQLSAIRAHNAQDLSWKMGLNQFSDWEEEEVTQKMTGLSSAHMPPAGAPHQLPAGFRASDLPASLDWRAATPAVVTPIKEQGLCGSCWAFAATEAVESAAAIATGTLRALAPQQLVSCMANPGGCGGTGGCGGSVPALGFNYTAEVGLALEADYPYTHRDDPCNVTARPAVGIAGHVDVPGNNATLLMHALTLGPVAVSVAANWAAYERGVFDGPHGQPCGYEVNHAVLLVGYGRDAASGLNYWTLRNSWTPQWGERGYMRILRAADGAAEPCGLDRNPQAGVACKGDTAARTYCGTCGLLAMSSYPTGAFNK